MIRKTRIKMLLLLILGLLCHSKYFIFVRACSNNNSGGSAQVPDNFGITTGKQILFNQSSLQPQATDRNNEKSNNQDLPSPNSKGPSAFQEKYGGNCYAFGLGPDSNYSMKITWYKIADKYDCSIKDFWNVKFVKSVSKKKTIYSAQASPKQHRCSCKRRENNQDVGCVAEFVDLEHHAPFPPDRREFTCDHDKGFDDGECHGKMEGGSMGWGECRSKQGGYTGKYKITCVTKTECWCARHWPALNTNCKVA